MAVKKVILHWLEKIQNTFSEPVFQSGIFAVVLAVINLFQVKHAIILLSWIVWYLFAWLFIKKRWRWFFSIPSLMILASFLYWFNPILVNLIEQKHLSTVQNYKQKENLEMKALKSKLTLLDLFNNDFDSFLKEDKIDQFNFQGEKINIKWRIYFDFETQNKFLGFYIPSNPHTFEICMGSVDHYKNIFNISEGVKVETRSPVLQPVEKSDLKFSGRIFIYHEYPIFESEKNKLRELYKNHGLSIQFRGSEYLWEKKKQEIKNEQKNI